MAQEFAIDRGYGITIFIDVENGIVKKCHNETPKFIQRMTELYVGKSISFLKEDFEKKFEGVYVNVRPMGVINVLRNINAINSYISNLNQVLNNIYFTHQSDEHKKTRRTEIKELIEKHKKDRYEHEKQLVEVINDTETIHGFSCQRYREKYLN